jgi:phospholipid N-methyltransferase
MYLAIILIFVAITNKTKILAKKSGFFNEFLKERKTVGAVAPSSKFLMKKMFAPIEFDKADVIVELGPGNGVFTKGLLEEMKPGSRLLSFELSRNFYEHINLNIRDEKLNLINDSAEKLEQYLALEGIHKVDYVVSSLPLAVIPEAVKNKILDASVKALGKEGKYIQFQYSLNARKLLQTKFKNVSYKFAPVNIPPAFVYQCSNL